MGMGRIQQQAFWSHAILLDLCFDRSTQFPGDPEQIDCDNHESVARQIFDYQNLGKQIMDLSLRGFIPGRIPTHPKVVRWV